MMERKQSLSSNAKRRISTEKGLRKGESTDKKQKAQVNWKEAVSNIELASIKYRTCNVIILAESDVSYSHIIDNVHKSCEDDPLNPVKFIIYNRLLEGIVETSKQKLTGENEKLWFGMATAEAAQLLEAEGIIPCDVLSQLIKLQIIMIIQEDIACEQKKIYLKKVKEEEFKKLFEDNDEDNESDKKKGKKGKPTKGGSKATKSDAGKGKKPDKKTAKGKQMAEDDQGPVSGEPRPLSQFRKLSDHPEITPTDRDIYVALVGFYDPEMIRHLIAIGVPVTCILEVTKSESILETLPLHTFNAIDAPNDGSNSNSIQNISQSSLIPTTLSPGIISEDDDKPRNVVVKEFWQGIILMFHGLKQHGYLENTFHMKYSAEPDEACESEGKCRDSPDFEKQCEGLINHILEVENVKRRYINYIRHVKVTELEEKSKFLPLQCLKLYNKLMTKFPPDCFSIALLISCLVEEVACRTPSTKISNTSADTIISSNSHLILPHENVEDELSIHGGIREQIAMLIDRYRKRHTFKLDSEKQKIFDKCYTCKSNPHINLTLHSNLFTVHPNDKFEMLAQSYKQLAKDLDYLKLVLKGNIPCALRRKYFIRSDIEKLTNVFNLESWATALNLTKEQASDIIHLYLFNKMDCNYKHKEFRTCDLSELLPHITPDSLLKDMKPRVCDFITPDSRVAINNSTMFSDEMCNYYENLCTDNFHFKEKLLTSVLLQELEIAVGEFTCFDVKYCPITDTVLYRFHNRVDEFGINSDLNISALRTPICIRDFCQYTVSDEAKWIGQQEKEFLEERQKQLDILRKQKEQLIAEYYKFEMPDDAYFVVPNSIKAREMDMKRVNEEAKATNMVEIAKRRKGDTTKDKKGNDNKAKNISVLEKFESDKSRLDIFSVLMEGEPNLPRPTKLPCEYAKDGQSYRFIAYNLGNTRLQLCTSTTAFHSLDGVSVFVERLTWLGQVPQVTVKFRCNKHTFIFHHKIDKIPNPLSFHFALADDTFITFAKPQNYYKTDVALCKRICQSSQKKTDVPILSEYSAYQRKPQELYFISEKQDCVIKCMKVPFSTESNIILSENTLIPFLRSLQRFNIKARVSIPPQTLRERQKRRHNLWNRLRPRHSEERVSKLPEDYKVKPKRSSFAFGEDRITNYNPKVIIPKRSDMGSLDYKQNALEHSKPEQKTNSLYDKKAITTRTELLDIIKTAIKTHLPVFKICSSRLHKFSYVSRVKSYISIPIGGIVKRILYRANYRRTERKIEIKKCFPIGCTAPQRPWKVNYDLRISLPSGLAIRNIPGILTDYPDIKQFYIDKGPQCKDIQHEECRFFLRNGSVAIKRCDGNFNVLSSNGNIFTAEVPYLLKKQTQSAVYRDINLNKLKRAKIRRPSTLPLHAAVRSLPEFQKFLQRTLNRRYRHMIDSNENRYFRSRLAYSKGQKKYCTDPYQFYLLQTKKGPFPEYSVVTPDGKKIKITNNKVYQKQKYYVKRDKDYGNEETLYEREDGTYCFLNGEGKLITQFPDGTKITTWYEIDPELVHVDLIDDAPFSDKEVQTAAKVDSVIINKGGYSAFNLITNMSEGWVSVYMYYEYAHPNYATVLYGGATNDMVVVLPNDVTISSSGVGPYFVEIGKNIRAHVNTKTITFRGSQCFDCERKCTAVLNVEPIYHDLVLRPDLYLFRVKDSYGKLFTCNYSGKFTRNLASDACRTNDNACSSHVNTDFQKLFAVNKDFSGFEFWSFEKVNRIYRAVGKDVNMVAQVYGYDTKRPSAICFRKYVHKPYFNRFFTDCDFTPPTLTKYKLKPNKVNMNPAYITQRVLHRLPDISKIEPIQNLLENATEHATVKNEYERFETFVKETSENSIYSKQSQLTTEHECAEPCPCSLQKAFESARNLHDRWYKWQDECQKYKQLMHDPYVPLYFKSVFADKFNTTAIQAKSYAVEIKNKDNLEETKTEDSPNCPDPILEETPSKNNISSKSDSVTKRLERQNDINTNSLINAGANSRNYIPSQTNNYRTSSSMQVEKEKSIEVKQTASSTIKTKTETLQITVPGNVVVLYNQEHCNPDLDVTNKGIKIKSEPKSTIQEYNGHKMLLLAGVSEPTQVEISKAFAEQNKVIAKKAQDHYMVMDACFQSTGHEKNGRDCKLDPSKVIDVSPSCTPKNITVPCNSATNDDGKVVESPAPSSTLKEVANKLKLSIDADALVETNVSEVAENTTMIVNPVLCHIERFNQNSGANNVKSTVSKILEILFDLRPLFKGREQDELIRGILRGSNLKANDLKQISQQFAHEIKNGGWVERSSFYKKLPPHVQSLQHLLNILNRHFSNTDQSILKTVIDIRDPETQRLKYRVTVLLADVISDMTNFINKRSGKLTWKDRLAILEDAICKVTSSNLAKSEVGLFLQSLEHATKSEISKYSESIESGSDEILFKEKKDIIDTVLKSLERYKGEDQISTCSRPIHPTHVVLEDTKGQKQLSLEGKIKSLKELPFESKSKRKSIPRLGSIFKHYSRDVNTCLQQVLRSQDDTQLGDVKNYSAARIKTKGKKSSSRKQLNTDLTGSRNSSKVTVSFFKSQSMAASLMPAVAESSHHCLACSYGDNDSTITISTQHSGCDKIGDSMLGFTSRVFLEHQPSPINIAEESEEVVKNESSIPAILTIEDEMDEVSENEKVLPAIQRHSTSRIAADYFMKKYNAMQHNLQAEFASDKYQNLQDSSDLKVIHQGNTSETLFDSDEDRLFGDFELTDSPSMLPLYTSSIFQRQPSAKLSDGGEIQIDYAESLHDPVKTLCFGKAKKMKMVHSLGTQTQTGNDVIVQTSDELLTGKRI